MPRSTRRLRARRAPPADLAHVAGEAAHAINNALGVLFGAEYLMGLDAGAAHAEALASLSDAAEKLKRCTDALNLIAQRASDLRIPRRSEAAEIPALLGRLCGDARLPLRWLEGTDPLEVPLAVDRELLRWLVSCALFSLGRGTPRDVEIHASVQQKRHVLELNLEARGASVPAADAPPNLPALALQFQREALAEAGVRVVRRRNATGQSVKLAFPKVTTAPDRTAR